MIARKLQVCAATLAIAAMTVSPLYAQAPGAAQPPAAPATPPAAQAPSSTATPAPAPPKSLSLAPDYSQGKAWFPKVISPYMPRSIMKPDLANSPRLAQLIQDGKLTLTIEDAIALALEDNLDIAVQRYTPWLDEMQLLSARSGAGGRVSFDPTVTGNINFNDATTPVANPLLSGVGTSSATSSLTQHTTTGNFSYSQGFMPGTVATMTFNNSRTSSSTSANVFNPSVSSTLAVSLTQPLLNGLGRLPNERLIIEDRNNVRLGEWQFKLAVTNDVTTTSDDYWSLVYAQQFVRVEQQTVAVDQQLYDDNKKQLDIGTMAPLDVLTAESQLASDKQSLIVAQTLELQDETRLLNDITKDPLDIALRNIEIVPTSPIPTADNVGNPSVEDAVRQAWQSRPELQEIGLQLQNSGIDVKVTTNQMLPTLNLVGQFSTTGLSGEGKSTTTTVLGFLAGNPVVTAAGVPIPGEFIGNPINRTTVTPIPGGITGSWDNLIHARFPTFQLGLQLTVPIRNRAAQAANGTAQLNQRQQQTNYQEEKNTIFLGVRNALIAVSQDRSAVTAAATARALAQQTFDDEQKKYQLGSSTSYNVVLRSRDLTASETTELQDQINLVEATIALDQAMGRTLEAHNISINDAKNAKVTTIPNIPGTPNQ